MVTWNAVVYVIGVLSGSNGHVLFVHDWPNELMDDELKREVCGFCADRGLKHNTW
jgi:hypothetical protein